MPNYTPQQSADVTGNIGALLGGTGKTAAGSPLPYTAGSVADLVVGNANAYNEANTAPAASTTVDPAAAAAAAAKAAELARLAAAQNDVRSRVSAINNIYNSRYGQVDQLGAEQAGKLNDRFGNESADVLKQVDTQNQQLGAAHAAAGTYDSSYRGNNVDTVTNTGQSQIRDLGQELNDNIASVGKWVSGQKSGFDASKANYDNIIAHLADEKNPDNLISLRNTLDSHISQLNAGAADFQTGGQNTAALNAVAPASARTVQLKTNLGNIVQGNSDPGMKLAIGKALITNSGLTPDEQQQLLISFQGDVGGTNQKDQQPTA